MGDRVLVRQVLTTVDAEAGTEVWLDDGEYVRGMVAGGFWEVAERVASVAVPEEPKKRRSGDDPA